MVHDVPMPPSQNGYCRMGTTVNWAANMCSTLLIVSMTFDRFYSIIMPHKATSFNTVKRAKLTITGIVLFSALYNVPHLFFTDHEEWQCMPYGLAMASVLGQLYYWISFTIFFILPFVSLLGMNSVIIHKIRNRSVFTQRSVDHDIGQGQSQCQGHGQRSKVKSTENQVFAMLLLVSFGFLILMTPGYVLFLFIMLADIFSSPRMFAGYYLFYNIAQKMHYSNHGVNFFFYVISGRKFRSDLKSLFVKENKSDNTVSQATENSAV